ncbi:hypothetical protein CFP56_031231 [Quercus suber]|uniref:Uncharacterized protein n=1 Tax=Quercus suber TaxID=58331 RepID=A0AAW0JKE6_QUESU
MAYIDRAFFITDEDMMMETSYTMNNKAPIKEIALAVSLLVFGTLEIIIGIFMVVSRIDDDRIRPPRWSETIDLLTHVGNYNLDFLTGDGITPGSSLILFISDDMRF